jgi:hypothetical protein
VVVVVVAITIIRLTAPEAVVAVDQVMVALADIVQWELMLYQVKDFQAVTVGMAAAQLIFRIAAQLTQVAVVAAQANLVIIAKEQILLQQVLEGFQITMVQHNEMM